MKAGIRDKDIRDFEKAVERLGSVLDRIATYQPDVMAFLDNGDMFQLFASGTEYDEAVARFDGSRIREIMATYVPISHCGAGAYI